MTKGYGSARQQNSFEVVDAMPANLRQCVHEYGFAIVNACLQAGVRRPETIRNLVREIWEGARQPRQRRRRAGTLDWLLLQAGAEISASTLVRVLLDNGLVIAPICPSAAMIEASKAEVSGFSQRVTKTEKHQRRLVAAMKAASTHLLAQTAKEAVESASKAEG